MFLLFICKPISTSVIDLNAKFKSRCNLHDHTVSFEISKKKFLTIFNYFLLEKLSKTRFRSLDAAARSCIQSIIMSIEFELKILLTTDELKRHQSIRQNQIITKRLCCINLTTLQLSSLPAQISRAFAVCVKSHLIETEFPATMTSNCNQADV